jgi:hypothetical protein
MTDKSIPVKIKGFEANCPICLEQWSDKIDPWVYPKCGHMICEKCYLQQKNIKRTCHICREKFGIYCQRKEKKKNETIIHKQILELKYEYYDESYNYID